MGINRDLIAGLVLIVGGAIYSLYAATDLPLGTLRRMGAGMFPTALGVMLAFFGLCIAISGLIRSEPVPEVRPRAVVTVLASVVAFAVIIPVLGFVPAVVATTILTSLALPGRKAINVAGLCLALVALTLVIFIYLLNLNVPLFRWRF